jgi:HD superfamily phosphohydrolase
MSNPVADPHRSYEVRCPVHGFIELNDWEREIISQPAFQRLRRIRQLAWTDQVYPGAMHTRFEHSLGVLHTATLLYDSITQRSPDVLRSELAYNQDGLKRHRALVRLAALLHDVGHGPFSHAAEDLLPHRDGDSKPYRHEDYSAAIVRRHFQDVIEDHPLNGNYDLRAEDVAALLEGSAGARKALFWRELISGQMDADRMDYLLRDSLHAGVQYGRFDLSRLVRTVQALPGSEGEAPRLGVSEGGWHAAEALILARYFMFTQIYFHKTRVAFDHHLHEALKELLPNGRFSSPEGEGLDKYLRWDDWRVLGLLADGNGGEHGRRLSTRDHYREVFHTVEIPTPADLEQLDQARSALGCLLATEQSAEKSWYTTGWADIPVLSDSREGNVRPLSKYSSVVANLGRNRQVRLYVRRQDQMAARQRMQTITETQDE